MSLPPANPWPEHAALMVLSGGSSRRLGRDKATTHVGGRPLAERLLAEVPAHVPVIIVGPAVAGLGRPVRFVREQPPGGGPLAGIGAGMDALRPARQRSGAARSGAGGPPAPGDIVGILAVDMPFAVPVVVAAMGRLAALGADTDAVVPVDAQGRRQPLAAAFRGVRLGQALAGLAPLSGRPVRDLMAVLNVVEWAVPAVGSAGSTGRPGTGSPQHADLTDIDTATQLQAARHRVAGEGKAMQEWLAAVRAALDIDVDADVDLILDVARDAAHNVQRPAAPLTTYLLGAAIARGADPATAAQAINTLARSWPEREHAD